MARFNVIEGMIQV